MNHLPLDCRYALLIILISFLLGCGHSRHVEVRDLRQAPLTAKSYSVEKGDTLYSIAWRFNFDYKRLARANNIQAPYTVYVGQVLLLDEKNSDTHLSKNKTVSTNTPLIKKKTHKKTQIASSETTVRPKKQPSGIKRSNTSINSQKLGVKQTIEEENYTSNEIGWIWPVSGEIIRQYSSQNKLSKGIDIAAQMGMPIKSSRSGKVVYAGDGLKGYGNLIIVRHSDIYLSAYAHNQSILVKEGAFVKQGQKIALLGDTGTQSPKLHFEIRKRGKPVNPLKLLPKQK